MPFRDLFSGPKVQKQTPIVTRDDDQVQREGDEARDRILRGTSFASAVLQPKSTPTLARKQLTGQ